MLERICIDTKNFHGIDLPLEKQMENIAKAGFKNVFYTIETDEDSADIDKVKELANKYGLKLVNVHFPFKNNCYLWEDNENRQPHLDKNLKAIEDCGKIGGVESVIIHPTSGPENKYVSDLGTDSFKQLCKKAQEYNIDVCIENLRAKEHLDWLFEKVNEPNLKYVHDTGHEVLYTPDLKCVERYGKKLAFVHFHDNDGLDDTHVIPGKGVIDLQKVLDSYKEIGYKGYIALEVCVWEEYFPSVEEHAAYVKEAFNVITAMNI